MILGGVVALAAVTMPVLYHNKYFVKKFIKEHQVLYAPARMLVDLKYKLAGSEPSRGRKHPASRNPAPAPAYGTLVFDAAQPEGRFQRFWGNLGYESFRDGILSGRNARLFELMQETNRRTKGAFRYVRAHNLFSDGSPPYGEGCGIYREDSAGKPIYDWRIADDVFDRIVQSGLKPIIEFGFMPDALASKPNRRQQWGKGNISPPKDYAKWEELVYQTVAHLRQRYSDAEVATWYFEVWNEPDLGYLFWIEDPAKKGAGDLQEYLRLYDYTVRGAKRAFPGIRVGGPASAGGWLSQMLEHTLLEENYATGSTGAPIDFLSTHGYGKVGDAEAAKADGSVLGSILWKVSRAVKHDHHKVKQAAQALPVLLTETGPSARSGLFYNTRYVAAWLVKMVDAVFYLGRQYGKAFQPQEVVFWSSDQFGREFDKQKGVATYLRVGDETSVLKRPAYNAFEALGYLSDETIAQTDGFQFGGPVHAIATRDQSNSVEVLIYNLHEGDEENATADSTTAALEIRNLPFERFQVRWYQIDEAHSNSYARWQEMGSPKTLTGEQFNELDAHDDLELVKPAWTFHAPDRKFPFTTKLQSNSVCLLVLTAMDRGHE